MDKEIHFLKQSKDSEVVHSSLEEKAKSLEPSGVDLRFQNKNESSHNQGQSSHSSKSLLLIAKQPEYLIFKGPVSSENKFLKSLIIDQGRQNTPSRKEEQSVRERSKQEESLPNEEVKVQNNEAVSQEQTKLYFFKQPYQRPYSKLLWFNPNIKNGRNIVYKPEKMRCQAVYRCEGCFKQYDSPAALGGHLSRCQMKNYHFQNIFGRNYKLDEILIKKQVKEQENDQQIDSSFINKQKRQTRSKMFCLPKIKIQEQKEVKVEEAHIPKSIKMSTRIKKAACNKKLRRSKSEESFE